MRKVEDYCVVPTDGLLEKLNLPLSYYGGTVLRLNSSNELFFSYVKMSDYKLSEEEFIEFVKERRKLNDSNKI